MNRRHFALGLGATLLAAPFLDILRGTARAAPSKAASRLVVFFCPNGTVPQLWRPSGTETSFQFPTGSILEPLTPYQKDVIVCDGIDFIGVNNHEGGMANMLTGGGDARSESAGMSVDQYVASKIGKDTRFPSLEFGVQTSAWGGNVQTRMSYAGPGTFVAPEDNPLSAYQRMFGAVAGNSADMARLLRRRKSVLDLVSAEMADLRAQLGKQEQQKLDQHLQAVRQTEQGVAAAGSCQAPVAPANMDVYANPNFATVGQAQMDLLVTALSCGLTRVASIQWSHTVGPPVFSWVGQSEGHHELSHKNDADAQGVQNFVTCERWYAQQFVYLIKTLLGTPDPSGGGSLLDTTQVLWCKELGDGRLHICQSVPFVLAGGGVFRTGRYLQYKGAPHQQLLTSVCQAMGLQNQSFGDASKGTGPLPGLV